jgi:hypothetical protein
VLGRSWNESNSGSNVLYEAKDLNLQSVAHQLRFALPDRTSGSLQTFYLPLRESRICARILASMHDDRKDAKALEPTVERFESLDDDESPGKAAQLSSAMGTVTISDLDDIYLVPAPSADPQGKSDCDEDSKS